MTDPAFAREVHKLVGEHAPGWWAKVHEQEGAGEAWGGRAQARVEIGHSLSDGFFLLLDDRVPGIPLTVESVRRWLTEGSVAWHLEVLATAPEPENPEVVKSVRRFAELFAWTNLEVRAILSTLAEAGALAEGAEYEWMRRMVGEGAPDLPRPNPTPMAAREYQYRIVR